MRTIHLKTARDRKGWTQQDLEAEAHVTQAHISRLERDPTVRVSFDVVTRLANALDVDPRALRFGPEPTKAAVA